MKVLSSFAGPCLTHAQGEAAVTANALLAGHTQPQWKLNHAHRVLEGEIERESVCVRKEERESYQEEPETLSGNATVHLRQCYSELW